MIRVAKTIGRLIAVLVDTGIIERKQAVWILEPLKDKAKSEGGDADETQDGVFILAKQINIQHL